MPKTCTRCNCEPVLSASSAAVRAARSASMDPLVAKRILVGKMLIRGALLAGSSLWKCMMPAAITPCELLRILLPRTPVNKGMKKGRGVVPRPSATGRLTGKLVVVEWTAIDVLAPLLFGDDRPSYVPSAAKGTVTRRKPPTSQVPWETRGAANAGIDIATIIAAKISASTHTIRVRRKVTFMFLSLVLSPIAFRSCSWEQTCFSCRSREAFTDHTKPLSPLGIRGSRHGSRLHHWLPTPLGAHVRGGVPWLPPLRLLLRRPRVPAPIRRPLAPQPTWGPPIRACVS